MELTYPGVEMGLFSGALRYSVYRGTNLVRQEVIAKTEAPSVAYKYLAGLKGFTTGDVARTERGFIYLSNRLGAVHEMKRVVKPGGRVCLIDTELDCMAIYSKKPELTRKLTSIEAATMPNPNSARELPALARAAGLKDIVIETFAVTSPHEFMLRAIGGALTKAAEDGIVPRGEVEEWLGEQASLQASGDFLQIWLLVLVSGTV